MIKDKNPTGGKLWVFTQAYDMLLMYKMRAQVALKLGELDIIEAAQLWQSCETLCQGWKCWLIQNPHDWWTSHQGFGWGEGVSCLHGRHFDHLWCRLSHFWNMIQLLIGLSFIKKQYVAYSVFFFFFLFFYEIDALVSQCKVWVML